jgi:aarF domain-containing kinase
MVDAHIQSIMLLAIPFRASTSQPYDFATQTVTDEIRALIPFMLQNRLTPPPRETYSLNRKLSGAFLLCGRLKARVDCAAVWEDVTRGYEVGV